MLPGDWHKPLHDHMNAGYSGSNNPNFQNRRNATNPEVNLIDFLEDIHVTPQTDKNDKEKQIEDLQIKMLEDFLKSSKLERQTEEQDAQFRSFLDKYENKQEFKPLKLKEEDIHLFEKMPELSQKRLKDDASSLFAYNVDLAPKVLVLVEEPFEPEDKDLTINEDLIEEVMFEQQLEKQQATKAANKHDNIKINQNSCKMPFTKITNSTKTAVVDSVNRTVDSETNNNSIFDEILTKNRVSYYKTQDRDKNINEKKTTLLNSACSSKLSNDNKIIIEQKALTNELVTKYDIKYLEAVKKIEKVFKKRNILKSDAEKIELTPGPTLYEKSVALPQMMRRLNERNNALETKNAMKMRLVLDPGSSKPHQDIQTTSSSSKTAIIKDNLNVLSPPHVLLSDCNRERLKAFESGKLLNNFVRSGTFFDYN